MGKSGNLLESKFVLIGLISLSVLSIYKFGKCIGEFAYYLTN
jgi:hypothetical protein